MGRNLCAARRRPNMRMRRPHWRRAVVTPRGDIKIYDSTYVRFVRLLRLVYNPINGIKVESQLQYITFDCQRERAVANHPHVRAHVEVEAEIDAINESRMVPVGDAAACDERRRG
jgi:hypothetical protein